MLNARCGKVFFTLAVVQLQSLANTVWTVPGYAISNYVVAADASSAYVATNFPTGNTNVVFYWVDGGIKQVQVSATVQGTKVTGQATFSVLKPLPSFLLENSSSIAADTNYSEAGLWLHFGMNIGTNVGIAMNLTNVPINTNSGYFYGAYFVTQLIQTHSKWNVTTGTNINGWQYDQVGLDNEVRYGGYSAFFPSDLNNNPLWTDSPGSPFGGAFRWASKSDSFNDYLMFRPIGTYTIPVPMCLGTWSWSGSAKTNGVVNEAILLSHANSIPAVFPSIVEYPQWTSLVTNTVLSHWCMDLERTR